MNKPRTVLNIRISEELKSKAEEVAKSEGRTLSNYVKYLVEQDIKKKKPN
jgi:predicted DNA-binding protein